ncbi:xaa-Pro aminopeptidase 3-like [Macrosteles quadrilineatus]|uniref:xaa-Pro aminopeptidase 3-like n=1 Tax=Macrosteles quadrilineatus TaxID=74068 RepID=UPI0023E2CFC7|nr:xaa-Pro aminopeptidase 3-like [Macrosteles quadrilineatus]XP_054270930.1 xaa-Pro aminopeptidase 3-like [Macrosteles quadrilineatus]
MFPISRLFFKKTLCECMFKESVRRRILCAYSTTTPKEAKELGSVVENKPAKRLFGQPTPLTHPHLLKPGEVVPGLQKSEFIERRRKFIHNISKTNPKSNHIVIIPSATKVYMSEKIPYVFRQNTDFLYLTGCLEPDSALVITVPNEDNASCILFLRKKDKHAEKWDGPRTGVQGALELFGVDQALPFTELNTFLSSYAQTYKQFTIWYDFSSNIHPEVHSVMETFSSRITGKSSESPRPVLHQQRLIKSAAEQELMAHTCEIACLAMLRTIAFTQPGVTEHQLFAKMDYESRMKGADFLAYPPVVASGNNANTIHYIANTQVTQPGEMVLMDAGCSLSGYCSDLTRTWPVSGRFTQPQLVLYEIVQQTQQQLMSLCHPANSLDHLFNVMCHLLGQKLIEAGVFKKTANKDHPSRMAYELCPHHASHYLGMDVHDTGSVSRSINMQPGMVITVEPGLYISENNENVNEEFCGQGIRIEDNILITDSNPVLLTSLCPKEPEVIESLVGSSL